MMSKGALAVFTANEEMPRNGDQCYPFRQNSDFFYLTGIDREGAFLIIYPDHPKPEMREILFIEPYSETKAIWRGEMLDAKQAKEISGCENVMYADCFNDVLKELILSSSKVYLNLYEYSRFETKVSTIHHCRFSSIRSGRRATPPTAGGSSVWRRSRNSIRADGKFCWRTTFSTAERPSGTAGSFF